MEKMGTTDSEIEGLFEQKKRVKNPLVPIGIPIEQDNVSHVTQAALEFLPIVWLCMIIDNYVAWTLGDHDYGIRRGRDQTFGSMERSGGWGGSRAHFAEELVLARAFITAGVLTAGLISFRMGNSQLGQHLMRARVVAQGATVALMVGTAYYYGEKL
ncbi:hypothetical protein RHSIM_Rhsim10G0024900 [Rhododendron simsii]|uniref:HIG1 domain-containing protein n=1 Tax=Rhododendron simsii TaxID=118357 RepID=A0A834GBY5_RHOSS|nr:hypothetical protein RHSIM_Rhsim10G0024900 [Rhododendron simsii]